MKRHITTLLALTLIVLVAGAFAGAAVQVKVKVQLANVRKTADMTAPILIQVSQGAVLDVVEKTGDWYKVSLTIGGVPATGFLHSSVVEEIAAGTAPAPAPKTPPVAAPQAARPAPARVPERAPAYAPREEAPAKKIFIMVGYQIGFQKDASTLDYTETIYQETASYSLAYNVAKGNTIDAAVGYYVGPSWGVKVGASLTSRDVADTTSFSIPHPLWMNTPRTGSLTGSGMAVKETDLYLDLFYSFNAGPATVDIYGGPCYVLSTGTIASAITFTESAYPYSTVTVSQTSADFKSNAFGFNVGASLGYQFGGGVGVFLDARYLSAKATYTTGGSIPDLSVTLGGFRAGGGLKVAF